MAVSTALRLVPIDRRDERWLQLSPEAGRKLLFVYSSQGVDRGKLQAVIHRGLDYLFEHCSERTWDAVVRYLDSDLDLVELFEHWDLYDC